MPQSGTGKIRIFDHFTGGEHPIAITVAAPINWGGGLKIVGDLAETDTGIVSLDKSGGFVRLSGNDEDGKGAGLATGVVFSAVLNGTLVAETRIELAALTARNVWFGFSSTIADDVAEVVTGSTATLTLTPSHICGFVFDSQLTASTIWHMPYKGGTVTGPTASASVANTSDVITAAQSQILRVEIDPNGTARWYVDGVRRQRVEGAVSPTALLGVLVAAFGTTTTAADADIDYLLIEAQTDWTP